MKKEIGKRLLSIMLALVMVIIMMPIMPGAVQEVQAAEDDGVVVANNMAELRNYMQTSVKTIKLGKDIYSRDDYTFSLTVWGEKTIDLNGRSLHIMNTEGLTESPDGDEQIVDSHRNVVTITEGSSLTIIDSNGGGTLQADGPKIGVGRGYDYHAYLERNLFTVGDGASLTIKGGTFIAGSSVEQYIWREAKYAHQLVYGTPIVAKSGSKVVIEDGTFIGHSFTGFCSGNVLKVEAGADVIVKGGRFELRGTGNVITGIPTIYGGTFVSKKFNRVRGSDLRDSDLFNDGKVNSESGYTGNYNISKDSWYHDGHTQVWIDGKEQTDVASLDFVNYNEGKEVKFLSPMLSGSISYTSGAFAGKSVSLWYGGDLKEVVDYASYRLKYQWQAYDESSETWDDISNATTADYVIGKSYLDKQIRVKITADGYGGYVLSQPITVSKQHNYDEPYHPALIVDYANKQITVRAYSGYKSTQEYVITTSSDKPTENQWADSSLKPDSSGSFTNLTDGNTYYIHTRFKETDTAYAGKVVYSTRGDMMETVPLTGFELRTGTDTGRYVQAGEYVRVYVVSVPYNATNYGDDDSDGVLGKNWYTNDNATIYANSKGAALDPDTYYDQVYVKADTKETVTVSAEQTIGYNNIVRGDITFDFCDSNGQYSFKKTQTSFDPDTITVGRGSTATTRIYSDLTPDKPIHVVTFAHDSYTDLSGVTIERIGDSNEILITASEDATLGKGGYRPTVNGDVMTNCLYINVVEENILVDSVEINTMAKKIKSGETCTLSATVTPGNATDNKVTWTSSDISVATVDGNGVVTGVKDGTATISAKAGDKTATCKIVVDNTLNTHLVYVFGGTASKDSAKAGETITITADEGEAVVFTGWKTEDVTLSSTTAKTTTFTMPDHEVSVTALHECTHSWDSGTTTKAATCTATGVKTYKCTACGATKTETIAKKGHSYTNSCDKTCNRSGCGATRSISHTYEKYLVKATLSKNGKDGKKCSVCGYVTSTTKTIYYPKTFKLSTSAYTYNGEVRKPSVTVKDSKGNTLVKDTDYTVSYESGRKAPGTYTVKITFKGKYEGTKRLYFTIAPKKVSGVSASQTTTTITLKWNKVTGADGYRIYKYNSSTKKYEKLKDVTTTSYKISNLKAGTGYKYKVRAYTKDDGTIWGSYSDVFATATKCKTPSITKISSTTKGKAALTWSNVSGESGYQVYYSSKKDSGYKKVASYKVNVVKGSKSKLTSGKTYYFKVRAYKKTDSGTVYSSWSTVKSIKIK